MEAGLAVIVVLAAVFAYVNGMHDASASIATAVATRALTPSWAVAIAGLFNFIGALIGNGVALTVASGLVHPGRGGTAVLLIGSALCGAIGWDLVTWYRGIPSSSSHALIGGLTGAAVAAGAAVHWASLIVLVALPMVLVPTIALGGSYLVTTVIIWFCRDRSPTRTYRHFSQAQAVSAAAVALGHGLQDGQKTIGTLAMTLFALGYSDIQPTWIHLLAASALALGTVAGGWRIVRTLGRRLVDMDPPRGFAAESVSATMLYLSSYVLGAPVSTTHTTTAAVVGTGLTSRLSAVRWRVVRDISWAWLLTPFISGGFAAGLYLLGQAYLGLS